MNELERRLRATAHADSTWASDARAPRDVKRSIIRRRALRSSAVGAAAAVIVGSFAVGGLGLTEPTELPTPTPAADLTIDEGTRAYATVALPDDGPPGDYLREQWQEWCGAPVPEPAPVADDFVADFDVPAHLNLDRRGGNDDAPTAQVSLEYSGAEQLPAFTGVVTALLVRDGTVVGIDTYDEPALGTFEPDHNEISLWRWHGWMAGCGDTRGGATPGAGEYEVVFVMHVHNDLAAAAQWSLRRDGYELPSATSIEAFKEGSYRCSQWEQWGMYQPLTCAPTALVGFELDAKAGAATVPYDTSLYTRDVNATLVSHPVPATLGPEPQFLSRETHTPAYDPHTGPVCGGTYTDFGVTANVAASWPTLRSAPTPGDTIDTALWLDSWGWEHATVSVPQEPRIWLGRHTQIEVTLSEGVSSTGWMGYEVIGWIEAESPHSRVEVSAYDGPAEWPLTVTDVQWCEGTQGRVVEGVRASDQAVGIIATPATVQLDDGTSHTDSPIILSTSHGF